VTSAWVRCSPAKAGVQKQQLDPGFRRGTHSMQL
jgi:hypothetical protein